MKKRKFKIYHFEKEIGEMEIVGDKFDEIEGTITSYDNLSGNDTLCFYRYSEGNRVSGTDIVKDFIDHRSSEISRPQLFENMKKIGMTEYDKYKLFMYANGTRYGDNFSVKLIEEVEI